MFYKKKKKPKKTKLSGGSRNLILLKEKAKGKEVEKRYLGGVKRKRLIRDTTFHQYNPFSPKVKDYSKDWMKMEYIPKGKMPTLADLTGWSKLIHKIAENLRIMHSKPVAKQMPEAHQKQKFDYRLVLRKFTSKIEDPKFVKKLSTNIDQFKILNKEEDFGLIHGDFWLNNIIVAKEVFFIDGEEEYLKTDKSLGNKYLDVAFFIAYSILRRAFFEKLTENKPINEQKIRKTINKFLGTYFGKKKPNQIRIVKALSLSFLSKVHMYALKEKRGESLTPRQVILREMNKDMCLYCLKTNSFDNLLQYFFKHYK